jgi:hypothetical protein
VVFFGLGMVRHGIKPHLVHREILVQLVLKEIQETLVQLVQLVHPEPQETLVQQDQPVHKETLAIMELMVILVQQVHRETLVIMETRVQLVHRVNPDNLQTITIIKSIRQPRLHLLEMVK